MSSSLRAIQHLLAQQEPLPLRSEAKKDLSKIHPTSQILETDQLNTGNSLAQTAGKVGPTLNLFSVHQSIPYQMLQKKAANTIQALAVWGFGGPEDEHQFQLDYAPREQQARIEAFQQDIGAEVTGQWNEETFVKAKFDPGSVLTGGQFGAFIVDL
ncbi:MAG: hypothetical protein IGS03_02015 [Candidatus Sericytochromatia bacterium]|nr:hypothetical protein [Candidatus Sericytochromatia bacterium]